jgi:transcriptional regulator with XRE-family HTH domain
MSLVNGHDLCVDDPASPVPGVTQELPDEDGLLRDLGRAMKAARRQAGLLQRELAHKTGYSRSAVANAEAGACRMSRDFYARVDSVLGTKLVRGHDVVRVLRAERLGAGLAADAAGCPDAFQQRCEQVVKAVELRVPDYAQITADVPGAWRNGISVPGHGVRVVVEIRVLNGPG